MKKIFFIFWEGIQKFLALLVILLFNAQKIGEYNETNLYYWKLEGGLSLANYIFLPFFVDVESPVLSEQQSNYIKHEYGHSVQSKILGPLYLFIIGIPSFLWAWLGDGYRTKHNKSYYDFYTESWANKLGGAYKK